MTVEYGPGLGVTVIVLKRGGIMTVEYGPADSVTLSVNNSPMLGVVSSVRRLSEVDLIGGVQYE